MPKKKKLPPGVRERNGRYTYRYSVEVVVDGKKKRKQKETPSFSSAKEAYDAGILIEADKQRGILVDTQNLTLGQWRDKWLEDYGTEREPRTYTLRNKRVATKSLCDFVGEHSRLRDLTGNEYQSWLNNLKKSGKKQGTVTEYNRGCRMMLRDAVRKKVIPCSPADDAVVPVFKQKLEDVGKADIPKFLEKDQLKHFLNIVRFRGKPQEYEIFLLMAYTGLRIGELLCLKTTDFKEKEKVISITKTLIVVDKVSNYEIGPPKNASSVREVSIGESAIKALKRQIEWRDKKIENGENIHDADFIFWSNSQPGYPASAIFLETRFDKLLVQAGLSDGVTPHSLRHTHVTLLAEAGEDLAVIQERLGHKNDDTTRRVYLHVTKKRRKAVPDKFEALMQM